MNVQPTDRILEIGCGHGGAATMVCALLSSGHYVAIDRSKKMIEAARTRNAGFVGKGKAEFLVGDFWIPFVEEEHMKKSNSTEGQLASELIDKRVAELGDWRGQTLGRMRKFINEADPSVVEEWKWMDTPMWSHDGIICTGETYKDKVKLTFAKGASLEDPAKLFNASLGREHKASDRHP